MIAIENTSKSLKGKQDINGLTLSVAEGQIYGQLVPNGAGKQTTLINLEKIK